MNNLKLGVKTGQVWTISASPDGPLAEAFVPDPAKSSGDATVSPNDSLSFDVLIGSQTSVLAGTNTGLGGGSIDWSVELDVTLPPTPLTDMGITATLKTDVPA